MHDEDEMDLSGLYWTPPGEMQREDAHKNLLEAIAGRRPDQVKLFSASAFEIPSAFPAGFFDVAIDMATHEACGVYRAYRDHNDYATKPEWFSSKLKDTDEIFSEVYNRLIKSGFFDWYFQGKRPEEPVDQGATSHGR
ncbi:hypothetical protein A6U98_34910 [Rhizobium sp. WYCCWR10014]|uniref:hypothetical protein n=1 Tax=Rhizobium sp. WYCCWR10014 TaxID=1825933 RepID=UPI0007E3EBD6|nr:hypothetical protein [Rhizobium sp. WYCCWR10014]OAV53965.1 hypothetical protein A6U98_34910 [Rhizobium sp. WYCCWR10014]